jgi:hypothetical protein
MQRFFAKWVKPKNALDGALDGASTKGLFASEHPYIFDLMLMVLIPFVICSFCLIF